MRTIVLIIAIIQCITLILLLTKVWQHKWGFHWFFAVIPFLIILAIGIIGKHLYAFSTWLQEKFDVI